MADEMSIDEIRATLNKLGVVPKQVVDAYIKELRKNTFVTREEFERFKECPLEFILEQYGAGIGTAIHNKCIEMGIVRDIDEMLRKLRDRVTEEEKAQAERLRKSGEQMHVNMWNEIAGTRYRSFEEAVKLERRARSRQKWAMIGLTTIASLGLIAAFGSWYQSNKRTAEGAAGVARTANVKGERALKASEELKSEFKDFKRGLDEWQKKHDDLATKESLEKDKKLGELEHRLTGQVAKKLDKTEWSAQVADLEKRYGDVKTAYIQLDALLNGEIAKGASRENAYSQYKTLAESSKDEIDKLRLRMTELQTKLATREYTDAEIGRTRSEYESIRKDLDQKHFKLLEVIKKMQSYMPYFDEDEMKDEKSEPKK